jgi:2-phosphosulfolactate phosphatase
VADRHGHHVTDLRRQVAVSCANDLSGFDGTDAIVVIDVIRATTTLATAIAAGRRCYPVGSVDDALRLARGLTAPVLAGELGGVMPSGFELNNSPSAFASRDDVERPLVLLTTSGTRLLASAAPAQSVFAACLRNWSAAVERLAASGSRDIALVGAATRGRFRREDQLCCAWIASGLLDRGFQAADAFTLEVVERWRGMPVTAVDGGESAAYLRRSGQLADLDYVIEHVDDLDLTMRLEGFEIIPGALELVRQAA